MGIPAAKIDETPLDVTQPLPTPAEVVTDVTDTDLENTAELPQA